MVLVEELGKKGVQHTFAIPIPKIGRLIRPRMLSQTFTRESKGPRWARQWHKTDSQHVEGAMKVHLNSQEVIPQTPVRLLINKNVVV